MVGNLQQDFPHLKEDQIRAALRYRRENPERIDQEIRTETAIFEEAARIAEEGR